tara:strand:- start:6440 stop:6895 length:456 start_codon:yes stop_codon:yes gene_type:complete
LVKRIAKTKIFFFYGTLRDHEVREAVIGGRAKQLNLVDGYLIGYRLYRVKNANYPLIVRDKSSSNKINGLVAIGLDKQVIRKLDMFEGKNYSRAEVSVFCNIDNEEILAEIYMPKKTLQYAEEWTYENWHKYQRKFFFHDDFRKRGVRSPG